MGTLLLIAFDTPLDDVLKHLTEVSKFFKNLCWTTLQEDVLEEKHQNIPITLCKLEAIFRLGFFNVMEHFLVHWDKEHNLALLYSIDAYTHFRGKIDCTL